jgi:dolichol-phosphate mannosyltransferase
MSPNKTRLSIVIPVFNEAGVLEQSHARVRAIVDRLPCRVDFCYVDDGSTDATAAGLKALARSDRRVRLLSLSRNYGHQIALTAGLDHVEGDLVVTIDGDGQHPPEIIPQMLDLFRQGYDVILAQRVERSQPASFKKWTSNLFYRLINAISGTYIPPGAADFRALSRRAVNALRAMPEYHRFLRGMVSYIGYPTVIVPYEQPERLGGASKYSLGKMVRLAMDAIFSFSLVPLYLGMSLGGLLFCLAAAQIAYLLVLWLTGRTSGLEPGWSSLMFIQLIIGGMLMLALGFIGIYVGYIFQEVKRRPIYLIKNGQPDE